MSGAAEWKRRVLLVGGHLDGRWVDLPESEVSFRTAKPTDFTDWLKHDERPEVPLPEFAVVDYRLERVPVAIRTANAVLWIGVVSDLFGPERDLAIVRALFQRDVAQLFQEAP